MNFGTVIAVKSRSVHIYLDHKVISVGTVYAGGVDIYVIYPVHSRKPLKQLRNGGCQGACVYLFFEFYDNIMLQGYSPLLRSVCEDNEKI